jgi:hypothetical protein
MEIKVQTEVAVNIRELISSLLIPINYAVSQKIVTCLVTRQRVWIVNCIYWTPINGNSKNYRAIANSHILQYNLVGTESPMASPGVAW